MRIFGGGPALGPGIAAVLSDTSGALMVRLAVPARSPPVWPAVDRILATAAEPAAAGRDSSQPSAQSSVSSGPPWSVALGELRTLSAAAVRCRRSSSKLRLSAFAEPFSTALALAHGSKGRSSRIERPGHAPRPRWSSRRPARSRWPCRRRSREPAKGGQARAEQRDGHHRDAAQHHDLLQHWPPDVGYPARGLRQRQHPGWVARGAVDGDGLGAGADPLRCDHHGQVLNELSHRLPRDAAVPDVDSGAQEAYANPGRSGQLPASQRLRRCARQGVGAVTVDGPLAPW